MNDFLIDKRNSNRYRVMVKEAIGHTAYCFSTPLYNNKTKQLVQPHFEKIKNGFSVKGTNGFISIIQNRYVFENHEGKCIITTSDIPHIHEENNLPQANITISPTLCGLRFTVKSNHFSLQLKSETKQESIRSNSLCFAVMREKFKPFLSLATLYALDGKGVFLPVELKYQDKGNQTYDICLFHNSVGGHLVFEINLYEAKLFQDTTVESAHPDTNNAYGAVAFVGKTQQFGEQWLYSRPDFSKIPDIVSERIEKALLQECGAVRRMLVKSITTAKENA